MLAVELHLAPAAVWAMDPRDMATVVAVLKDRADQIKRARR